MEKMKLDLYENTAGVYLDESMGKHQYTVTDELLNLENVHMRGVTDVKRQIIAKPGLMRWPMDMALKHIKSVIGEVDCDMPEEVDHMLEQATKAHTQRSDRGKDIGTEVHGAIEHYLVTEEKTTVFETKESKKSFDAFIKWYESSEAKKISVEQPVYSRERQYCGKYDAILNIQGEIVLVDFKTTNVSPYALRKKKEYTGLYPEDFMQLGFYSKAYHEANPESVIHDLLLVNCTKEGKLIALSAREIGWTVADCENLAMNALDIADGLKNIKKGALDTELQKF